ncbi:gamma-glutamyl hercynylcysteine S-oxide synthase [Anaerolineae bacterium]|nr:gamma-glutamyl hercynylcysteine S-oxide synthase [Anaerolineae bacterium]
MRKIFDNALTIIGVVLMLFGVIVVVQNPPSPSQSTQLPSPTEMQSRSVATPTILIAIAPSPTAAQIPPTATPVPPSVTPTLRAGEERIIDGVPMMYVPAGEFLMGSEQISASQPPHQVYLDAFWIDKYEVINNLYRKCVDAGRCSPPSKDESLTYNPYYTNPRFGNYPVNHISWKDAVNFCSWANKRLPTEAEWEKAARGTDGRTYPWGNNFDESRFNPVNMPWEGGGGFFGTGNEKVVGPNYLRDLVAVGSHPNGASPYGVMDMAGNAWEWVADWYGRDYYSVSPRSNPKGSNAGKTRVVRGGVYRSFVINSGSNLVERSVEVYTFIRIDSDPDSSNFEMGMRCAK